MYFFNPNTMQLAYFDNRNLMLRITPYMDVELNTDDFRQLSVAKIKSLQADDITVEGEHVKIHMGDVTYKTVMLNSTLRESIGRLPRDFAYIGSISDELDKVMTGFSNVQITGKGVTVINDAMVFIYEFTNEIKTPVQIPKWIRGFDGEWYLAGKWLKIVRTHNDNNEIVYKYTVDIDKRAEKANSLFSSVQTLYDLDYALDIIQQNLDFVVWYLGISDNIVKHVYSYSDGIEVSNTDEYDDIEYWYALMKSAAQFLIKTHKIIDGEGFHTTLPNGVSAIGFIGESGRVITTVTKSDMKYGLL